MEPGKLQWGQRLPRLSAALQLSPRGLPGDLPGLAHLQTPERLGAGWERPARIQAMWVCSCLPRQPSPSRQPPQAPSAPRPFRAAHCAHLSPLRLSPYPLPCDLRYGVQASARKSLAGLSVESSPPWQACTRLFLVLAPTLFICLSAHRGSSPWAVPPWVCRATLSRSPYLHKQVSDAEIIKQQASSLTASHNTYPEEG